MPIRKEDRKATSLTSRKSIRSRRRLTTKKSLAPSPEAQAITIGPVAS